MNRRLIAISPVDHPGGAETTLLRLLAGLRTRDWGISLTTPGHGAVCGRLLPALPHRRGPRLVLHIHDMVSRVPRIWRCANVVLASSEAVASRLRGLNPRVVCAPVEPDPPDEAPPWRTGNGPVVGFIGRIEPRKGPLDLVVVGDDPYATAPDYTRAVLESGQVEHYGWSTNAPGLMRHLDVLVLPSHQEPFGTVLADAVDDVLRHRKEMSATARDHARRCHVDAYLSTVEDLIAP